MKNIQSLSEFLNESSKPTGWHKSVYIEVKALQNYLNSTITNKIEHEESDQMDSLLELDKFLSNWMIKNSKLFK